jgi:hypothetical protein
MSTRINEAQKVRQEVAEKNREMFNQTDSPAEKIESKNQALEVAKKLQNVAVRPKPKPVYEEMPAMPMASMRSVESSSGVTVFTRNFNELANETITLPALSTAYGTIQFGEEISASESEWASAEINYAFLGPNRAVVELVGCRVHLEMRANFNSSKVKGILKKLVCMSPDGRVFERAIEGKIIEVRTEYGGVKSDIIMAGPAKGIALEAMQTMIKAYGAANAAVETTVSGVSSRYDTEKVQNVTGNKQKYVEGKVYEASGDFLTYIINFYKQLEPTLALAPGAKVHIALKESVEIPRAFFKKSVNQNELISELKK